MTADLRLERPLVAGPALISSLLAPVFFIGGTVAAELAWPGFDPVAMTISELAAGDAPTRVFMTLMFVLTGVCHLVTAVFARGLAWPGRAALALAGVALFAVAAFPLPAVGQSSPEHRYSAMAGFVLLALWPVLSMRLSRRYPWLVRPLGATLSTLAVGAACVAFAWIEASPDPALVGLAERVAAYLESLWPAVVVLALALRDRRATEPGSQSRGG
ncbi:MAG: DUF998 domain-containing protein [Microcella sp.]|uniref:DUF998 domain-containing protein n=1 Tax=Microcella sp. TaxID=1913979 RepID=UPI0033154FBF